MAILMDGKAVSAAVREEVAREAAALTEQYRQPCLAVILVGDDPHPRYMSATSTKPARRAGSVRCNTICPRIPICQRFWRWCKN